MSLRPACFNDEVFFPGTIQSCILIVMFMYSYCYVRSDLYILLSLCQLALFGYPEVFPCFFLRCKANARV
jgi:hypothetical protein